MSMHGGNMQTCFAMSISAVKKFSGSAQKQTNDRHVTTKARQM
jgi:hypothetical protein